MTISINQLYTPAEICNKLRLSRTSNSCRLDDVMAVFKEAQSES